MAKHFDGASYRNKQNIRESLKVFFIEPESGKIKVVLLPVRLKDDKEQREQAIAAIRSFYPKLEYLNCVYCRETTILE